MNFVALEGVQIDRTHLQKISKPVGTRKEETQMPPVRHLDIYFYGILW